MILPEQIGFDSEIRENMCVEDLRKSYEEGIAIWVSASGTTPDGKPSVYRCVLDYKGHVKYMEKELPGKTANQAMIIGAIDAISCINKPARIFLITPTALGFVGGFKGKGINAYLIQQLCESICEKDCNLTEVQYVNGADVIKRFVYACKPTKDTLERYEKKRLEKQQYRESYFHEKYYGECLEKVVQLLLKKGIDQEIIDEVRKIGD